MKQKIVIKVAMHCQDCRSNAMEIAAVFEGVISVAIEGKDLDLLVVIGNEVDSPCLIKRLRKKVGNAVFVTVEEVKPKSPKPPQPPQPPCPGPKCCCSRCSPPCQGPICFSGCPPPCPGPIICPPPCPGPIICPPPCPGPIICPPPCPARCTENPLPCPLSCNKTQPKCQRTCRGQPHLSGEICESGPKCSIM